jgi:hypothetical protein
VGSGAYLFYELVLRSHGYYQHSIVSFNTSAAIIALLVLY